MERGVQRQEIRYTARRVWWCVCNLLDGGRTVHDRPRTHLGCSSGWSKLRSRGEFWRAVWRFATACGFFNRVECCCEPTAKRASRSPGQECAYSSGEFHTPSKKLLGTDECSDAGCTGAWRCTGCDSRSNSFSAAGSRRGVICATRSFSRSTTCGRSAEFLVGGVRFAGY